MYRMNKRTNNFVEVKEPWRNCTWTVELEINARQSIVAMTAVCTRTLGPDIKLHGTDTLDVAPFDDLGEMMRQVLLNSALAVLDQMIDTQLTFPLDPDDAA